MSNKYDYDAVVIGAGMGGLVCGCYLAKAGLKTLIVEKNEKPGGYCSSFERDGFHFDACVHSLGSLRKGGILRKVLEELDVYERMNITRHNPSDTIIAPDYRISFWNDLDGTIEEFQGNFPKEAKNIDKFFSYLVSSRDIYLNDLRNNTFDSLLKEYFNDYKLRAIISLPLLGNTGLPASLLSGIKAVAVCKEFLFDGGYYPKKGIQALPDILREKFEEFGGKISLANLAKKIKIRNNQVEGVVIGKNTFVSTKYIISSVDARQTFLNLIGNETMDKNLVNKLNNMEPSLSMFILYLGIDDNLDVLPQPNSNIWFLPNYDIENMYKLAIDGEIEKLDWFLVRISSDKKILLMFVNTTFKNEQYWKNNKERLIEVFIRKIEQVIPNLSKHIIFKDAATPVTLYRQTLNYKGAAYGWAGLPSQFSDPDFSQVTSIKNLYLTGHWTTLAQGVSGVTYLGSDTAKIILQKERKV